MINKPVAAKEEVEVCRTECFVSSMGFTYSSQSEDGVQIYLSNSLPTTLSLTTRSSSSSFAVFEQEMSRKRIQSRVHNSTYDGSLLFTKPPQKIATLSPLLPNLSKSKVKQFKVSVLRVYKFVVVSWKDLEQFLAYDVRNDILIEIFQSMNIFWRESSSICAERYDKTNKSKRSPQQAHSSQTVTTNHSTALDTLWSKSPFYFTHLVTVTQNTTFQYILIIKRETVLHLLSILTSLWNVFLAGSARTWNMAAKLVVEQLAPETTENDIR